MNTYRAVKITCTAAAVAVILCCRATAAQPPQTPAPLAITALPDLRYIWFVSPQQEPPRLNVWRVMCKTPLAEGELVCDQFSAPGGPEERLCAWDAYGDWVWILTNRGLHRIGRFRPVEGKAEQFEPELIQPGLIGHSPVGLIVADPRIIIAGDAGLFVFDRHSRHLNGSSNQPVKRLIRSPIGIIAESGDSFFLVDMSFGAPVLKKTIPRKGRNWPEEVPPGACALADPAGARVVVITNSLVAFSYELDQLQFGMAPDEQLREACLYGGRLWLLTSNRLVGLEPGVGADIEYDLSEVTVGRPEIVVQAGVLRCGPIAVRLQGEHFDARVVNLLSGDIPRAQAQVLALAGVQRVIQQGPPKTVEDPAR